MNNTHAKSSCCQAKVTCFGGRRRLCTACGKTFSIRQKKRGPKNLRLPENRIKKVLLNRQTIFKSTYVRQRIAIRTRQYRFQTQLNKWCRKPQSLQLPPPPYLLLVDGLWKYFKSEEWVLYLFAVKPINQDFAYFFDPVLLKGKECLKRWKVALDTIPGEVQKNIVAMVSDGFVGCGYLAKSNNWIHQRCHFHLLLHLHSSRGKRKKSWRINSVREQIYRKIKTIITCGDAKKVTLLVKELIILSNNQTCPRRLQFVVRDTLINLTAYRAYLTYLKFNLPNTINTMEAMNSLLSRLTSNINNQKSWLTWAKGYVRAKIKLRCRKA